MNRVLMCAPDYYQVEYVINPWMEKGSVDTTRARQQWESLVAALEGIGVAVEIIPQVAGLPDMVFATDQGIVQDHTVFLSNFCHRERQGETTEYERWFQSHGYQTKRIDTNCFEGGEVLPYNGHFFLGTGFRSCDDCVPALARSLATTIIPLQLVDSRFYHLDTCFFPFNDEVVFYYPPAFSQKSTQLLQDTIPTLIELTHEEAFGFSANSVVVGKHVLVSSGNPTFVQKLTAFGYSPIEIDISEFIKAGGGIHCLILPLS